MTTKSSSGTPFSIVRVSAILAFLACINAASAATTSKGVNVQPRVINFEQNDVSSQRFLRTEERKLGISLSGLEQAASGTKSWAAKLIQKLQLKWWQLRKKTPNDVFTKLKLQQTGPNLFESPGFSKWVAYVTKNSKEPPDMTIFSTLAYHYSDDALAKMLLTAKQGESTNTLATKLEGMQLTNWIHSGKSQDYVFKTLALDQAGTKAFANPQFARWTDFIAQTNTKNPEMAIFSTLGIHYSDDALVKMFAAAKEVDGTKALATKLEGMQLTNWVHAEKSPDYVFKTLALDKMGAKGFENPLFARWTEFITKANTKDPDVAIYTTLGAHYSDEALATMIATATKVESTENLAANLRSLQFEKWVSQGKTPESVNTMLGVATNTDDLTKKVSRDYEKFYGKKPAID
ncbi:hypothetical protein JG687_00014354 [Phytophthora cactorum]|uniref:RxLR effector protein n=1 Tax=Phytophthora cactorum TaxID=29920 RepID=A0A8T1TWS6_9STRA|nr:hypothetical protein PC120_g26275 [Phytophthora cactorum]KAG3049407.1 hypothetical protein PC121_g18921 [Phytophthora cactorum]KAG3158648.1 hypothetical protein PC128_g21455 [Phytophthora cactorum]KAG4044523.1 hypothetical protein PC123_g20038 [Phytophthora cactorum]KAG6950281.1 hypothetical protein JG687_00014354 [Phytophthora cactorum]